MCFDIVYVYNNSKRDIYFLHIGEAMKKINSKLNIKATAEIQKEVEIELNLKDPPIKQAKAILEQEDEEANEDTKGNDRRAGDRDDK